jgi:hypothetical protein
VESYSDEIGRKRGGQGTCPAGSQITRHTEEVSLAVARTFGLTGARWTNAAVCQSLPRGVREKENGGSVLTMGGAGQ